MKKRNLSRKTAAGDIYSFEQAVEFLAKKDRILNRLIEKVGDCALRLKATDNLFHALAEAIVYQQLHGKAAATIFGRVLDLYKKDHLEAELVLSTSDELLRNAGLSRSKLTAIKDLAAKTIAGVVPDLASLGNMSDEEIIKRLTTVKGIGIWTVQMLLIFRLGRLDVLPVNDYGVRKGFALVYRKGVLPSPGELAAFGEKWRPYRTIACWYLWRALEIIP